MTVTYKTLDDPLGTEGTVARGINDNGQIVGVTSTLPALNTASSTTSALANIKRSTIPWRVQGTTKCTASTTAARSSGCTPIAAVTTKASPPT